MVPANRPGSAGASAAPVLRINRNLDGERNQALHVVRFTIQYVQLQAQFRQSSDSLHPSLEPK